MLLQESQFEETTQLVETHKHLLLLTVSLSTQAELILEVMMMEVKFLTVKLLEEGLPISIQMMSRRFRYLKVLLHRHYTDQERVMVSF